MAYQQKLWQNRLSEYPARRLLTKINEGDDTILVEVEREEGTIMQQGDAFSAANMNDLESRIAAGIGGGDENMAPIEQGPNSANPYAVNDLLIYNGQLYRATKAIIVGNSLVSGVNITPTTLSKEVKTTQTNLATTQTNLSNLTTRVSTAETNINSANTRINTANTNITNVTNRTTALEGELTANGSRIYMDYKNGRYGYNTSANRGADTFHPFKSAASGTLVFSGKGTQSFNISGFYSKTANNFIVQPVTSNVGTGGPGGGWTVDGSGTSTDFTLTKSVSGNTLTVTCVMNSTLTINGSGYTNYWNGHTDVNFNVYYVES